MAMGVVKLFIEDGKNRISYNLGLENKKLTEKIWKLEGELL